MADQNLNININEFDRSPQGVDQIFTDPGTTPGASGTPNEHAPRPVAPPANNPGDSGNTGAGGGTGLTGQLFNQAVMPSIRAVAGSNPVTGAIGAVGQAGLSIAEALSAIGAGGGGGAAAGGAAGGALAAAGPIGIAIGATVIAIAALGAAAIYVKDQFLSAADEVAYFNSKTASAKANQTVGDIQNKINRANYLQDEFSELIELQTTANRLWSELGNSVMKDLMPFVNDGMKQLIELLQITKDLKAIAQPFTDFQNQAAMKLIEYSPIHVLNDIRLMIRKRLNMPENDDVNADFQVLANKLLQLNLNRVNRGQLPQNGGLGG